MTNRYNLTPEDYAAARSYGVPRTVVYSRMELGWDIKKALSEPVNKRRQRLYALYKGEELLADGTMDEIADELGVARETVVFYGTNAYKHRLAKRKNPKNYRELVYLGDDEEE